jgi:hypothetical protein
MNEYMRTVIFGFFNISSIEGSRIVKYAGFILDGIIRKYIYVIKSRR